MPFVNIVFVTKGMFQIEWLCPYNDTIITHFPCYLSRRLYLNTLSGYFFRSSSLPDMLNHINNRTVACTYQLHIVSPKHGILRAISTLFCFSLLFSFKMHPTTSIHIKGLHPKHFRDSAPGKNSFHLFCVWQVLVNKQLNAWDGENGERGDYVREHLGKHCCKWDKICCSHISEKDFFFSF